MMLFFYHTVRLYYKLHAYTIIRPAIREGATCVEVRIIIELTKSPCPSALLELLAAQLNAVALVPSYSIYRIVDL